MSGSSNKTTFKINGLSTISLHPLPRFEKHDVGGGQAGSSQAHKSFPNTVATLVHQQHTPRTFHEKYVTAAAQHEAERFAGEGKRYGCGRRVSPLKSKSWTRRRHGFGRRNHPHPKTSSSTSTPQINVARRSESWCENYMWEWADTYGVARFPRGEAWEDVCSHTRSRDGETTLELPQRSCSGSSFPQLLKPYFVWCREVACL